MNPVDFYFDFADPFSYLSGKRLIDYIQKHDIDPKCVRFRSFQLRPNDYISPKNYIDFQVKITSHPNRESYIEYFNNTIIPEATSMGLIFDVENIISTNSALAHAGLQYAHKYNKHCEYFLEVMHRHFALGENYSDIGLILSILESLDLNSEAFIEAKESLIVEVKRDRFEGLKIGLQMIPSYYRADNLLMMGTGSQKGFREMFSK